MRVIAGSARRLLLKTVEGMDTRPTQDRIKETLFSLCRANGIGAVREAADIAYNMLSETDTVFSTDTLAVIIVEQDSMSQRAAYWVTSEAQELRPDRICTLLFSRTEAISIRFHFTDQCQTADDHSFKST